ncbi:hypothetical protein [Mycoplasma phocimorsus]|uniref:hypothetical protein n=1 Tax=Mycoplasma phocimorsus TaxID=3045839 RepID=UPI0024C054DE|nr:hypothetical protein [Mycoplasma phocimorsus]MDJ1647444.1 hypothetical protein [Mycoplasma phocimorsus]MDJ1648024.1 hypothetical protein [Mycoplasma phocimorsus]
MNRLTKFISVAMVFPGVGILISCTKINKNAKKEENFNQNKNIKNSNKTKINNDNNSPQNPYKINKQKDNKLPVVESTIGIEKHVEPYEDVIDEENTDILITNNIKNKKRSSNWFSNLFANKNKTVPITIGGILGGASLILGFVGLGFLFEKVVPQTKYGIWSYSFPSKVEELLKSIFGGEISEKVKIAGSNFILDLLRITDPVLKNKISNFNNKLQNFIKNKTTANTIKESIEKYNFIAEYFDISVNNENQEKENNKEGILSLFLQAIEKDSSGKTAKDFVNLISNLKEVNNKKSKNISYENWHQFIFTDDPKEWYDIELKYKMKEEKVKKRKKREIQLNKVVTRNTNTITNLTQLQNENDLMSFFDKLVDATLNEGKEKTAFEKHKNKFVSFFEKVANSLNNIFKIQKTTYLKNNFASFVEIFLFAFNTISGERVIDAIRLPWSISMKELSEMITKFLTKNW